MIPILFSNDCTDFSNNGLGGLSDCISAYVTEERNGMFELEIEYPIDGLHYSEICEDMIILAKPSRLQDNQAFRIYAISKPINGIVTINAEHISYQANYIPIMPSIVGMLSAVTALDEIEKHQGVTSPFNLISDMTESSAKKGFSLSAPKSLKSCIVGSEGSLIDVFGGELKYDNFTISLLKNRGTDNGVKIAYGKNLVDLKQESSIEDVVTGVATYWQKDDEIVILSDKVYYLPNAESYSYQRILPVDITSEFDEDVDTMTALCADGTKKPTPAELLAKTQELYQSKGDELSKPKVDLTVDFVDLADSLGEETAKNLERVELCDKVTVQFEKLGVNSKAKVVKTVYDVLKEKYKNISLSSTGNTNNGISKTIADNTQSIDTSISWWQEAVQKATKAITGNKGGCIVLYPAEKPQEILIMDTVDKNTAKDVWRWNSGGLAHSSNGYNGPYDDVAITADGQINGKFIFGLKVKAADIEAGSVTGDKLAAGAITADKLSANSITTEKISAGAIGGWNLENNSSSKAIYSQKTFNGVTVQAYIQVPKNDGDYVYIVNRGVEDDLSTVFMVDTYGNLFCQNIEVQGDKIGFKEDGSAKFAGGKILLLANGNIQMRGTNGTDVINIADFLESLDNRVKTLENK